MGTVLARFTSMTIRHNLSPGGNPVMSRTSMNRTTRISNKILNLVTCAGLVFSAAAYFGETAQAAMNAPATVRFVPFSDPWPKAQERWMDISNHAERQFSGFTSGSQPFSYANNYALD